MGIDNYYRDMRRNFALVPVPLTKLFSTKVKFKWTYVEQKASTTTKKILGRDALLSHPNFSEEFIIHTDDSKNNIGGLMIQNGKTIVF